MPSATEVDAKNRNQGKYAKIVEQNKRPPARRVQPLSQPRPKLVVI